MGKGLNTKSGRMLQMIRHGDNPNEFDPTGARVVCANLDHDYSESYEFENRRRRGVNGGYFNAVTDGMAEGQLEGVLCYNLNDDQVLPFVLAKCAPTDDVIVSGGRERVYYWPQYDRADRAFFAVEEGRPGSVLRGGFGMFTSFKFVSKTGKKSSAMATLPFVTQAPKRVTEMTGASAQNGKIRLLGTNVNGPVTLGLVVGSNPKKNVTLNIGNTKAQIEAAFAAQGLTVNSTGTIAAGAGERHTVSGSGNVLSIYGITVDFTAPDPKAALQTAIRALPGRGSAVVSGTITRSVAGQFVISGAGTAVVNGTYSDFGPGVDAGTREFRSASGYRLYRSGGQWVLRASDNGDRYFQTTGTPVSAYPILQEALNAALPAPTVSGTGNATPASLNITITYDAPDNVSDVEPVPGPGYVGASVQPGLAVGQVEIEFFDPPQTRVVATKEAGGAGYVLAALQQGGKGIAAAIVEPMPILPGHLRFFRADTLAGLDAPEAFIGRISEAELEIPKLAEPAYFHNNTESGPVTYSAHKEPDDMDIMISVTLPTDENGDCAGLTDGTRVYVSKESYWRVKMVCPIAGYEQTVEFFGSVGKNIPLTYNENVEERKFVFNLLENRVLGWNFRWKTRVPA